MHDYIRNILKAPVYDVAIESPLDPMPRLSARLDARVSLKREDLQPVFSFKLRGAYNKIASLPPEVAARGIICASAGNHAQGVALAARRLGLKAIVVMPATTPAIKVEAVRSHGADVVLNGENFDEAYGHARLIEAEKNLTFIHPYDDPDVIAGQGTIGMEILRQHPATLEAIFVPIGGGGLAAGVALYSKFLRPDVRIVGVEPNDAASMARAIDAGARVTLDQVGLFADGVAVKQVGEETFRLCRDLLDEVITVSTDEICAAIKDIFEDTRAVPEPSGALAVAGLKAYAARGGRPDRALVAINSGANMNFDRLRHISERAEIGEQREALLAVTIPERPGSYRSFIQLLGTRSITEFNYRYSDPEAARIFVGVRLTDGEREKRELLALIADAGYPVVDMSDNELAKLHVRYMVGGRAAQIEGERIFRFEFPERPGALLRFLNTLSADWNISLFHYRNHGADYGRVLAGIQSAPTADDKLSQVLLALGYPYWEETQNDAYRAFLSGGA